MTTLVTTIEKVLDNAFVINRKVTKHRNEFSYNTFERPITHLDFFQLLHNSGINLSSFELIFSGKVGNGFSGKTSLNFLFQNYGLGLSIEKLMIDEKSIESDFTKMGTVLSFYY